MLRVDYHLPSQFANSDNPRDLLACAATGKAHSSPKRQQENCSFADDEDVIEHQSNRPCRVSKVVTIIENRGFVCRDTGSIERNHDTDGLNNILTTKASHRTETQTC